MKALIIGAAGFVGSYLAENLINEYGWTVYATKLEHETFSIEKVTVLTLDVLDGESVYELLQEIKPDYIFHLAAQSSVALSWKKPELTLDVNIKGCVHLLEAVRKLDYSPRVLLIGSGEEYGYLQDNEIPVKEDTVLRPGNFYAATKACQNMFGKIYADAYQMQVMMVRAFNHIGPGQAPLFVVSDFCKQVAEIEYGKREPVLYVGNLSAKRDFTDVRDIVNAYAKLIQKGSAGETYNIGSGHAVSIQSILDQIVAMSEKEIRVETDAGKMRPVDVPIIEADISKIVRETGWRPEIPLHVTLREVLEYWREQIKQQC